MSVPDEDVFGPTLGAPAEGAVPPLIGDRYRIVAQLGEGGMGTVHLAMDTILGVQIALKVIGSSVAGGSSMSGGLRELRDEVLLAQRVTHENVCRTFDLEELAGQWVLKMEYVRGETLAARLARERHLSLDDTLTIARQLIEGIDASHRRSVVHRDLKPRNIMLEQGTGRVVIMDFGIARSFAHGDDRIAGTPHYMAPEQARGGTVDARTDLYALGCVLYEMLVGDVLFPASSIGEAARRHAEDPPPDVRTRVPETPEWVAKLILALVEKEPVRRPRDARAVATQLAGPSWTPELRQLRAYSENSDRPALSPDGTLMAYISDRERRGQFRVYLEPVAGGPSRALTPPDLSIRDPIWTADATAILAVTVDGRALRIDPQRGAFEVIAEGVLGIVDCAEGLVLLRRDGATTRFVVRDGSGAEREFHVSPTLVEAPRCDRTGRRVVYARTLAGGPHPPADLWLVELDSGAARPLTHDSLENSRGVFHPDGRSVLYSSSRAGQLNVWEVPIDGGAPIPITTGFGPDDAPSVSADGTLLLYHVDDGAAQLFALEGGERRAISPGGRHDYASPAVSPDGREVVAVVTPWGRPSRIAVVSLDDLETRDLVEGTAATFSADGRDVLYATEGEVRAVPRAGGESRLVARIAGQVQGLVAGPDGALHLMVRVDSALEAWRVSGDATAAVREAPAPIAWVVPAPAGGWRAVLRWERDGFRVRLCPAGAPLDDATARDLPASSGRLAWSADGRFLFHVVGEAAVRVDVATGADVRVASGGMRDGFTVAPDGETLYLTAMTPHIRRQLIVNFGDRPRP